MAIVHLFSGKKGEVGKSFVCRSACSYHLSHKIPFGLFEANRSNPDLLRIYGEATGYKLTVFSEGKQ